MLKYMFAAVGEFYLVVTLLKMSLLVLNSGLEEGKLDDKKHLLDSKQVVHSWKVTGLNLALSNY